MAVPSNSNSDDALLKNLVPLNTLSDEQLGTMLSRVTVEKAKKGEYLFREGDTDHQNIYLLHGTIALLSGQKEMDLVSSGTQTSRFALAHQLPRKHSAQARTAVTFVRIDSRMLSDMLARSHSASYEVSDIEQPASGDWMSLLLQSSVFQQIPPANLQRVMMRMEEIQVGAGDLIIRQGDEGDYFYLISQGECSVTRSPEAGHAPVELAKLRAGKGFGEEALISDQPRSSSVTMVTDGVLVRLNKEDFIELVKQPLSRTLSYEAASEKTEAGALWLDVRTPEEYEEGHLPGAINLPFFSLRFQASSLTLDRSYVVYGAEVGQSATAAYLLTDRGAEVFVLDIGWVELEEVAGLSRKAEEEAQLNNVIDFNRDAEDPAAEARLQADVQRHKIEKLQREMAEAQASFDEELKQRHIEVKLLKQALAVAKANEERGDQQTQSTGALKQELDSLRESLTRAEAQLAETTELNQKLEQSRSRLVDIEPKLAALQEELTLTRSLSDDFRQRGIELQTQLKESQERHESQQGRLKEQITELRLKLETAGEAQQQAAEREGELEQLKAERFELESALRQLREQQTAGKADEARQLAALQTSLDEARTALENAQNDFQQRESALQARLDDAGKSSAEALAQANSEVEKLQAEGQFLQSRLDQANLRLAEVEEQSSSEKTLLQQRVDELQQSRQQLEAALQKVQAEEQSGQQRLSEALASATERASEEQARLDAALDDLNQELEAVRGDARQERDKRVEMEALLEQEHQTAAFLQRSLKTAEEAVEVIDGQCNTAEQARQALEAQLSELQQTLDQLQGKQDGLQQSLEQAWQEKAELEQSLEQAHIASQGEQQQTAQTVAALAAAEQQLAELRTELQQLHAERGSEQSQLQANLEALRQELAEQQAAAEAAQAERDGEQGQQQEALEALRQELAEQQAAAEAAQATHEAERQTLQAQLTEVQSQSASQSESLIADLEARQQEIEQLREAMNAALTASEASADRGELEVAQQALRESQEQITSLKREIEGLREVQMEMESQLSDDVDEEVQQLRSALESEEKKRSKAEGLAQKVDVLRRERQTQDQAVEILNEEVESLGKVNKQLEDERGKLLKQLREIRSQYTDLVNENDQLHSEMSGVSGDGSDSSLADDLLSQMDGLRLKADRYEQERDQARSDAARMRREVGELRSVIETYVEQIQDVRSFDSDEQVTALHAELDMVRRQAHDDMEQLRIRLQQAESRLSGMGSRDVDFVAEQQAVRQEMVSLQQALNEKDHLLRLSQNQCRSLEDAVEDRDKEVDQLKRKLELLLRKAGGLEAPPMQPDAQQREEPYSLDGESDPRKAGLGRLFRKK